MMLQQKSTMRRTARKGASNLVLADNRPTDLRSPVEGLLRDLALVLRATAAVRQDIEADKAICSAIS